MTSSMSSKGSTSGVGTYAWAAPEVIDEGLSALSLKADVYAVGIIIWECMTQLRPWDGKTDGQIIKAIIKEQRPPVVESMHADLRSLMETCWSEDPKARPHFDVIVKKLEAIAPPKAARTSSIGSSSASQRQSEKDKKAAKELKELKVKLAKSERARAQSRVKREEVEEAKEKKVKEKQIENGVQDVTEKKVNDPPPPPKVEASSVTEEPVEASEETKALEVAFKAAKGECDIPKMKELKSKIEESKKKDEKAKKEADKLETWKEGIALLDKELENAIEKEDFDSIEKIQQTLKEKRKECWAQKFTSNEELKKAAKEWVEDAKGAKEKYGHISNWDVSEITSFEKLFDDAEDFNEDISRWDTGNVKNMYGVFQGCKNFNQSLGKVEHVKCYDDGGDVPQSFHL